MSAASVITEGFGSFGTAALVVTQGFGIGAATADVYGYAPRKKPQKKKFLLTIRGNRYLVPEDEIDLWLSRQEDEIVETVKARPRKVTVKGNPKPVEPPRIVLKTPDTWLANIVADANRRVRERLAMEWAERAAQQRALDDDDEEVAILMMSL